MFCIFRFDNVRIPRENILNSVADVSSDGKYLSAIKDADQVRVDKSILCVLQSKHHKIMFTALKV